MKKLLFLFFILIAVLFIGIKASYAEWVWSSETSWVDPEQLTRETTDQQYKYAIALMIKREYISAIGIFKSIIKSNSDTELAEESQLNIAKSYFLANDYKNSFRAYEEFDRKRSWPLAGYRRF